MSWFDLSSFVQAVQCDLYYYSLYQYLMNAALPLLSDCAGPLNRGWGEYITRQKGEQEQPKKKSVIQ